MKISEFAALNHVTPKLLRHYDEIGLLKPAGTDRANGYRQYDPAQSQRLDWILILRHLEFPLGDIRRLLDGPTDSATLIAVLTDKRRELGASLDEAIGRKIQIDRLIHLLEREGFHMDQKLDRNELQSAPAPSDAVGSIDLMRLDAEQVHKIKRNMPNTEMFLDAVQEQLTHCTPGDPLAVLRSDLCHFKRVNDEFGFEVGDQVIVVCHDAVREAFVFLNCPFALGRGHGDEFVVFAKAEPETVKQAAQRILRTLAAFDWSSFGLPYPMTVRIGIVTTRLSQDLKVRHFIDASQDPLHEARRLGTGTHVMQSYD